MVYLMGAKFGMYCIHHWNSIVTTQNIYEQRIVLHATCVCVHVNHATNTNQWPPNEIIKKKQRHAEQSEWRVSDTEDIKCDDRYK